MPASEFVQKREEIAAKTRELYAITRALGPDNAGIAAAAKVAGLPDGSDGAKVAEEVQRRTTELNALNEAFEPYRTLEANKARADELHKRFGLPATAVAMPSEIKPGEDGAPVKSLGRAVVESPIFEALKAKAAMTDVVPLDLRAVLFQTSAGWAVESPAPQQLSLMPKEPFDPILSRIPQVRYGEAIYTFMEETTHTDNAAEIAEDAAYGESEFVLTKREKNIRKVGVSIPVTDEQLADVAGAEDFLNGRLEFQLRGRVAKQVLAGSGVAPNIEGTESVTGIQTQALGADSSEDAIFKLLTLIRSDGFAEPEVVFLNSTKWQTIRLRKTADGAYLYGPPSAQGPETIWGLPLVQTARHTSTKAISGAYRAYSLIAVKQDVTFATGFVNTQFTKGERTIRADVRAAMVHLRPKAFGVVTGL